MIYTIGHSTLPQESFMTLVKDLDVVMDIRSHPTSKKWPQFRIENMSQYVNETPGKEYRWEPRLGGWSEQHIGLVDKFAEFHVDVLAYTKGKFPKQRIDPKIADGIEEGRPHWYNQGLYDFQFFMSLPEFIDGAESLIEESKNKNIGIMCCEVLPFRCHRSMVADYLYYKGIDAINLQPKCTCHSKYIGNRIERYHPYVTAAWGERKCALHPVEEQQTINFTAKS